MTLSIFGDTDAWTVPDRDAFGLPADSSGDIPLINWALAKERRRPERTARIIITSPAAVVPVEPAAPRWYRGVRRLDRSRAALLAARGGIGGSR